MCVTRRVPLLLAHFRPVQASCLPTPQGQLVVFAHSLRKAPQAVEVFGCIVVRLERSAESSVAADGKMGRVSVGGCAGLLAFPGRMPGRMANGEWRMATPTIHDARACSESACVAARRWVELNPRREFGVAAQRSSRWRHHRRALTESQRQRQRPAQGRWTRAPHL